MEEYALGWPDIFIAAVIFLSVIIGLLRGLIKESISLVTWVIAIILAVIFSPELAKHMTFTQVAFIQTVTAFFIIFISAVLVGSIFNFLVGKLIRKTPFSAPDRALGGIFGLLRGVVVVTVVVLLAGLTPVPTSSWWQQSFSIEKFEVLAVWVKERLPEDYAKPFKFPDKVQDDEQKKEPESVEKKSVS
jgi:membrane protein required for colicin V production